jgi:hypothetical protein
MMDIEIINLTNDEVTLEDFIKLEDIGDNRIRCSDITGNLRLWVVREIKFSSRIFIKNHRYGITIFHTKEGNFYRMTFVTTYSKRKITFP